MVIRLKRSRFVEWLSQVVAVEPYKCRRLVPGVGQATKLRSAPFLRQPLPTASLNLLPILDRRNRTTRRKCPGIDRRRADSLEIPGISSNDGQSVSQRGSAN